MWQPEKLQIQNLITHKDTTFKFKRNKCIMIFGINSTDSGADSNGGGKSTVLEGMTLALTGETNREVSKDEFIMDDEDECYVEMSLSNEVGDTNKLEIKRWFFRKKTSKIQVWENGIHNKEISSVAEANKRVYELIGLSKEDLLHFFMVGQETNYSFLTANDTNKKDIITRFSNIEFINEKIEKLKLKRKDEMGDLETLNSSVQKIKNRIEFFEERNSDLTSNFEKDNIKKIDEIKLKIQKEGKIQKEKEIEIKGFKTKIKTSKKELESIVVVDVTELTTAVDSNNKKLKKIKTDIDDAERTISSLEGVYDDKITCPNCSHEFSVSVDIEISEIPTLIGQSQQIVLELENQKTNIINKNKNIEEKIDAASENEDKISDLQRKIKRLKTNISDSEIDIEYSLKKVSNYKKEIEQIKKSSTASEIEKNNKEIKSLKGELKILKSKKIEIDERILDIDYWVYHFGKKGFLTFLTNKSIKSIEGVTNSYLKKMNSDLQILIDGFTTLQSGDVREKINISIIRSGLKVASFNRYSGGEKGRIKLANILGLQHLINLTAKNGGLNFLGLDEVFEGLDQTGQMDVLNILENLKVTSLVITHRKQPIGAENEIFIEKKNGISRITDKKFLNLPHEKSIKSEISKIRRQDKKNRRNKVG